MFGQRSSGAVCRTPRARSQLDLPATAEQFLRSAQRSVANQVLKPDETDGQPLRDGSASGRARSQTPTVASVYRGATRIASSSFGTVNLISSSTCRAVAKFMSWPIVRL